MRKQFTTLLKENALFLNYAVVFLILLNGVLQVSGTNHLPKMMLYFGSFILSFVLFKFFKTKKLLNKLNFGLSEDKSMQIAKYLSYYVIISIVLHFFYLGGSPGFKALFLTTSDEIVHLRRSLTEDSPKWLNYISAFNLRGFLPFLVFYFYQKGSKKLYYILLFLGCLYCFSLMQKSYIISLLAPVFVLSILEKKWLFTLKYSFLVLGIVLGLSFTANPEIRQEISEEEMAEIENVESLVISDTQVNNRTGAERIVVNLWRRISIVPGEMVSRWFDAVPTYRPFLYGDGYRLLAKVKGNEFRNYSAELYPLFYPSYAKRGFRGSVNSASFMYDYANFGKWGLVLSGFILALLLTLIDGVFIDFKNRISLNFYSILILSSAALTTTLLSGGWGILIALYFVLLRNSGSAKAS